MAALHGLDMIDGAHQMIKSNWPGLILPRATRIMSQSMVIYYMAMVLFNETLIQQVDPAAWLLYFGALPLVSRMILQSLHSTVRQGIQGVVCGLIAPQSADPAHLTPHHRHATQATWRFDTGLRATLNKPLKRLVALAPESLVFRGFLLAGGLII
jgi:hypothetical protein